MGLLDTILSHDSKSLFIVNLTVEFEILSTIHRIAKTIFIMLM